MSEPPPAVPPTSLAKAEVVFCGGGGLTDPRGLDEAAAACGAAVAGSAVLCDGERLAAQQLVGVSGSFLRASCYVGFGVHGSPYHLAGIEDVDLVVSVNRDPTAPIHARAELAIVADAQAVLLALAAAPRPNAEFATAPLAATPPSNARIERLLLPRAGRAQRLTSSDPGAAAAAIAALLRRSKEDPGGS